MGRKKKEDGEQEQVESGNQMDLMIAQIEKQFGKGSIMTLGKYGNDEPEKHLSTGCIKLDIILGKGGLTFGRTVEVYGKEQSSKTTLALSVVAHAQSIGLKCAYIDKEGALDLDYCKALGVNLDNLLFCQPDSGEEALSIVEKLIAGGIDVIVFDSIGAINPLVDLEKDLSENAKMAGRAAMLTRFFERNSSVISKNKVLFICINQLRDNLNPYGGGPQTTGGRALRHATSYRLELSTNKQAQLTDDNGNIIGNTVTIKTVKNKSNVPYKTATYDLIFGKGIDKYKDLVDIAEELGIIEKSGSWFSYGGQQIAQGVNQLKEKLSEDNNLFEEIRKKVLDIVGSNWGPEGK